MPNLHVHRILLCLIFSGQMPLLIALEKALVRYENTTSVTKIVSKDKNIDPKVLKQIYTTPWRQQNGKISAEGIRIIKQCLGKEIISFLIGNRETDRKKLMANWLEHAGDLAPLLYVRRLDSRKYERASLDTIQYLKELWPRHVFVGLKSQAALSRQELKNMLFDRIQRGDIEATLFLAQSCKNHHIQLYTMRDDHNRPLLYFTLRQQELTLIIPITNIIWSHISKELAHLNVPARKASLQTLKHDALLVARLTELPPSPLQAYIQYLLEFHGQTISLPLLTAWALTECLGLGALESIRHLSLYPFHNPIGNILTIMGIVGGLSGTAVISGFITTERIEQDNIGDWNNRGNTTKSLIVFITLVVPILVLAYLLG